MTAAALIVLAVVPPSAWSQLGSRVQEVGAGSFKLSLAAGGQQSVAEAIRSVAKTSQISGGAQLTQSRFVEERLQSLLFLTSPPSVPSGDSAASTKLPDPFDQAEEYIQAKPAQGLSDAEPDQRLNEGVLNKLFECSPAPGRQQRPAACDEKADDIRYYEVTAQVVAESSSDPQFGDQVVGLACQGGQQIPALLSCG